MEATWGDAGLTQRDDNVELVRWVMEAYHAGDFDALLELLDPEVEIVEWPEAPDHRTFRGRDGALEAFESWGDAWEWVRVDVDEIVGADDRVLLSGRTRAKGKGSSLEVEMDAFNVYTVRDGRVVRIEFFTTREPALHAAGLTESV
jgi:ketosteroid isomerase-like protein